MLKEEIQKLAQQIHADVVSFRRHLHRYPELSYQEYKTSEFIKEQLDAMGIAWSSVAGTGIVAIIEGELKSDAGHG